MACYVRLHEKHPPLHVGITFSCRSMSGLLFADEFVGLTETGPALQYFVDLPHNYSNGWHFEPNVRKCAVVNSG